MSAGLKQMEGTINSGPGGRPIIRLRFKRLALHGDGVGPIVSGDDRQGKVAFVPYTLPGETVAAQPAEEKKKELKKKTKKKKRKTQGKKKKERKHKKKIKHKKQKEEKKKKKRKK